MSDDRYGYCGNLELLSEEMNRIQKSLPDVASNINMDLIKNREDLKRLNKYGLMPDGTRIVPEGNPQRLIFFKYFEEDYVETEEDRQTREWNKMVCSLEGGCMNPDGTFKPFLDE